MIREFAALLLVPACLALSACVVVIGTDTEDGVYLAGEDNQVGGVRHDGDALSRDVARALAADAELVAEDLRVSSEDGVVVLKGRVRGTGLLTRAIATARNVAGVEQVVSKVTVEAA